MLMLTVNLRELRLARGWSEAELAHRLNMSQSAYSRLECGTTRLDLERLQQLAAVFGKDLLALLHTEGEGSAAPSTIAGLIASATGQVDDALLARLHRLHAAHCNELAELRARHARAARRMARLLGI